MKTMYSFASIVIMLLCAIVFGAQASGQTSIQRDPLKSLKRAISEAGAPALTTDQETQLNTLISSYQAALPEEPDEELEAAREAYDAAILAGDLSAAQAQATIIANRTAALTSAKLTAKAQFSIGALAVLKTGGQYDLLVAKFGADRTLSLVESLIGHSGGGGGRRPR